MPLPARLGPIDASYRTGNFINWVTKNAAKDIVAKLNVTPAEISNDDIWKEYQPKHFELGEKLKRSLADPKPRRKKD
jgi:hypothetical protein